MPFPNHVSSISCLLELGREHGHVDVGSNHVVGMDVVLVGVVRPPPSEKGHSRGRAVLEHIVAVEDDTCLGQHIKVWGLDGRVAEAHISMPPVIH